MSAHTHTHTHTRARALLCTAAPTGRIAVKFDVGELFMKICRETPSLALYVQTY
jgi:hypothetical protein